MGVTPLLVVSINAFGENSCIYFLKFIFNFLIGIIVRLQTSRIIPRNLKMPDTACPVLGLL